MMIIWGVKFVFRSLTKIRMKTSLKFLAYSHLAAASAAKILLDSKHQKNLSPTLQPCHRNQFPQRFRASVYFLYSINSLK